MAACPPVFCHRMSEYPSALKSLGIGACGGGDTVTKVPPLPSGVTLKRFRELGSGDGKLLNRPRPLNNIRSPSG
jgi:hypothetical protein